MRNALESLSKVQACFSVVSGSIVGKYSLLLTPHLGAEGVHLDAIFILSPLPRRARDGFAVADSTRCMSPSESGLCIIMVWERAPRGRYGSVSRSMFNNVR